MLNRYKKAAIVIALSGVTALTGLAHAQDRSPAGGTAFSVMQLAQASQAGRRGVQNDWLNLGQIYDRLVAAGYTDIREIERERDGYEAKARDTDGRSVKLYLDPLDGRIVGEKFRDRDRHYDREGRRDRDGNRDRDARDGRDNRDYRDGRMGRG